MKYLAIVLMVFITGCNKYSDYRDQIRDQVKIGSPDSSDFIIDCVTDKVVKWAEEFCSNSFLSKDNVTKKLNDCFANNPLAQANYSLSEASCSLTETINQLDEWLLNLKKQH